MSIEYGPEETIGREFKGEGYVWVLFMGDGKATYGKVNKEGYTAALQKLPFDVWHPLGVTPGGLAYMSASSKTLEPWIVISCTAIATVHPAQAQALDEMVKSKVSKITVFTENQMPKPPTGPRGIIKE